MTGNARPVNEHNSQDAPTVIIAATWKDPQTGALYVHQDLTKTQDPWAEEAHIKPMAVNERFGDVESFAAYIARYGSKSTLVAWNNQGIKAVLDYAESETVHGRQIWQAMYPFIGSQQWQAWKAFANGKPVAQRAAVEKLEDLAIDIVEPAPTDLMNILRNLRASASHKAEAELRPDGTSYIAFIQDKTVKTAANMELPATFTIAIPVLKGHVDADGRPVIYRLQVRVRAQVGDDSHLELRFSLVNGDVTLEDVYADRVKAAEELLGERFVLLRAAD